MQQTPFEEVPSARKPIHVNTQVRMRLDSRRLLICLLMVLIIAGLLFGFWRSTQPHSYRLVGTYPVTIPIDLISLPGANGFFMRESETSCVMRDWRDGHVRWRVTISSQANFSTPSQFKFSLSDNGRYLAAITGIVPPDMIHPLHFAGIDLPPQLLLWDNGVRACNLPMPFTLPPNAHVMALDDGRVFVWHMTAKKGWMWLMRDARIVASCRLPDALCNSLTLDSALSPDGQVLIVRRSREFAYCTLQLTGRTLRVTQRYTSPFPIALFYACNGQFCYSDLVQMKMNTSLFTGGVVLTQEGAVFGARGLQSRTGWSHTLVAPGGRYTFQIRRWDGACRVFCPITGDYWAPRIRGNIHSGKVTGDGRYALVWYSEWLPENQRVVKQNIPAEQLVLYERPGRLRARMRLATHPDNEVLLLDAANSYPSPDGHAVVMMDEQSAFRLYRW